MVSDKHQQLFERVSESLRGAILNGDIKPGEWIRQKQIAEKLGVSQIPVREALKMLVVEGLVEHIPYRGVRVVSYSQDDIDDIYAQRACLESRAARAAAKYITQDDLDYLYNLQRQIEENLALENVQNYRDLNRKFHQTIYRLSRREYLIRTLDQMWATFPTMLFSNFSQTLYQPLHKRDAADVEEHKAIINALANGDFDNAEKAVLKHIYSVNKALKEILTST